MDMIEKVNENETETENKPVTAQETANGTDFFETETFGKDYFPLPETDYDENGNLRKVRKRMVKKLLCYEMKALFKPMLVVSLILGAISLLLCVYGLTVDPESDAITYWLLSLVPYVYAVGAILITPLIASSKRYKNHFFGNEGYLTFSIPASAEEQILAKRISGLLMALIADAIATLSVVIAILPFTTRFGAFEIFSAFGDMFKILFQGATVHTVFAVIETAIIAVLGSVLLYTAVGAWNCLRHRGVKRRTVFAVAIVAYIVIVILEALTLELFGSSSTAPIVFDSVAWLHISNVLTMLFYALLIWLFTRYELRTLRYKLNLK